MSDLAYNLLIISLESLICKNIYSHRILFFAELPDKSSKEPVLATNQPELAESQDSRSNPTNSINPPEVSSQAPLTSQNSNTIPDAPPQPSSPNLIKKANSKNDPEDSNQKEHVSKLPHRKENISTIPMKRFRSDSTDNSDDSPNKRKPHIPVYSLPSQYSSINNLRESYNKNPERGSIRLQQVQENRPLPISLGNIQGETNKASQNIKQIELKPKTGYVLKKIKELPIRKAYQGIDSVEKRLLHPYEPAEQFQEEKALNPDKNDDFCMDVEENHSRNDLAGNEDKNEI
ncbi:unnamed protein product [Blepharisma stoltei]|uniref:Uncharacterized protein n=1 Tax=Blepharisma stoltei TaxID=1481888 RepID=A0AAU9ITH9_9CILI|nr:unnamed protein product [Blepharisma stoltei]